MFDTHCHLNLKTFLKKEEETIKEAKKVGVNFIVVPAINLETSKKAVGLALKFFEVYAAVGIHPNYLFKEKEKISLFKLDNYLKKIERLLKKPKVVAVGEVGLDYSNKDFKNFVKLQKEVFTRQINLAIKYKKALIVHSRQAKDDLLEIFKKYQERIIKEKQRIVFHCLEPDDDLLNFARKNHIFIGVDGDVTYERKKQEFVKKIPLDLLVLETDSPFLLPEPLKSKKLYPNKPKNLFFVAQFISKILNISFDKLIKKTDENAKYLFQIFSPSRS